MATITVRMLDPVTWEPAQGNGLNNSISDLQAVTQIIATRLRLFQGEWFLNTSDGLPLFQKILGSSGDPRNISVVTNLISARILGSPYTLRVVSLKVNFENRQLNYSCQALTAFGLTPVINSPAYSTQLVTSS